MKNNLHFYIKPFLLVAALVMFICYHAKSPLTSWKDWLGCVETTVFIMTIISVVYVKWLWRYCFWENTPRFSEKYKGTIHYTYGKGGIKSTEMLISQTLFSIYVKIKTNEITSTTITSDLIEENDSWFLYYTYITGPKAVYADKNPIQRGTARLEIEKPKYNFKTCFLRSKKNVERLEGSYWTSGKNVGDMVFQKEDDK